ncbi:MAG TPA: 50S ribosomal protein L4 [Thermodesulfobacteriota bacterium]|nr:50S ribosomal protein L4 [Thermodesulfobacteriota bacterium]
MVGITMPVVDIVDITNNKVGETSLTDDIFGVEVNPSLIYEVVKMQLANRRSGTASTKNRSLVSGGGKKPWRQKGTGRARAGTIRSPLWKGGGTIFGPVPRDYSYLVPKKVRKNALKAALSQKLQENRLVLVDAIRLDEAKSKKFVALMKTFKITNALIIDEENKNLSLSARNVANFKVLKPAGLNVFDLMLHDYVILTKPSLESIEKRLLA